MKSKPTSKQKNYDVIKSLLTQVPGQSVKELAEKIGDNRTVVSGYLKALEDLGWVTSRKVGPARVYYVVDRNKQDPHSGSQQIL